jgi:hypothetical protein
MDRPAQEVIPSHVYIILTEVELIRPSRPWFLRIRKLRRGWNEEQLALLALTLGNACFVGLVAWWLW